MATVAGFVTELLAEAERRLHSRVRGPLPESLPRDWRELTVATKTVSDADAMTKETIGVLREKLGEKPAYWREKMRDEVTRLYFEVVQAAGEDPMRDFLMGAARLAEREAAKRRN